MFAVNTNVKINYYYIILHMSDDTISDDSTIAQLIGLSHNDYNELLSSYGAYCEDNQYNYFSERNDIEKAIEYFNKNYLLVLKLLGKI